MFIEDKIATESMTIKTPTPKIIFFDIDDTLSRNGIIAEHNKTTLEELAGTDIKLVISTGRSKAILPADILALLEADVLDAIICMNGQYSFDKRVGLATIRCPLSKRIPSCVCANRAS